MWQEAVSCQTFINEHKLKIYLDETKQTKKQKTKKQLEKQKLRRQQKNHHLQSI